MDALLLAIMTLSLLVAASPVEAKHFSGMTWSRTYENIVGRSDVQTTSDGGFIVTGVSDRPWVLKTNALGEPGWEKGYSLSGYCYLSQVGSIQETRDRGYLLAGSALSFGRPTGVDGWLLKLDRGGNVQWSKTYGGLADDGFYVAEQTNDGGYVVAGNTASVSSHVFNGWILRLDTLGNLLWQKAFVGEDIHSVDATHDGGFVVAGTVGVDNMAEGWVFKLDSDGNSVWQKAFEVPTRTDAYSAQQTHDGGYVVVGSVGFLYPDALILRLSGNGNIMWERVYNGGENGLTTSSIREVSDGEFIVSGRACCSVTGGPFLLKLNANGDPVWEYAYGPPNDFYGRVNGFFYTAQETRDQGFIVAASTASYSSPCCEDQAWVLKSDANGVIQDCSIEIPLSVTLTDAPITVSDTTVPSVSGNAVATPTGVNVVTISPLNVQTQCVSFAVREREKVTRISDDR